MIGHRSRVSSFRLVRAVRPAPIPDIDELPGSGHSLSAHSLTSFDHLGPCERQTISLVAEDSWSQAVSCAPAFVISQRFLSHEAHNSAQQGWLSCSLQCLCPLVTEVDQKPEERPFKKDVVREAGRPMIRVVADEETGEISSIAVLVRHGMVLDEFQQEVHAG
jgi:hypothetical protein